MVSSMSLLLLAVAIVVTQASDGPERDDGFYRRPFRGGFRQPFGFNRGFLGAGGFPGGFGGFPGGIGGFPGGIGGFPGGIGGFPGGIGGFPGGIGGFPGGIGGFPGGIGGFPGGIGGFPGGAFGRRPFFGGQGFD